MPSGSLVIPRDLACLFLAIFERKAVARGRTKMQTMVATAMVEQVANLVISSDF